MDEFETEVGLELVDKGVVTVEFEEIIVLFVGLVIFVAPIVDFVVNWLVFEVVIFELEYVELAIFVPDVVVEVVNLVVVDVVVL